MTNDQFIKSIHDTFHEIESLVLIKNSDYANSEDPFKNFRSSEHVGVPIPRAILVRMMDKLSRISNLLEKEPSVAGEKLEDTLNDLIGYTAILKAYLSTVQKP